MPDQLVTIWSTMDLMEAQVMKSKLDAFKIFCVIDHGLSSAFPLLTQATGWINLKVKASDLDRARDLLEIKEQE